MFSLQQMSKDIVMSISLWVQIVSLSLKSGRTKYNGELYDFENIRVISAGVRDADAEGVEGMSASKMRKAVADGDFESFRKGTPKELDDGDTRALFDAVRAGMKIKKKAEVSEMWEIAPSMIKEVYVNNMLMDLSIVLVIL